MSATKAQQSLLNTLDVQQTASNQFDRHNEDIKRTAAEVNNARQQTERAVVEAKRAADASFSALETATKALEQIEKLTNDRESKASTTFI